MKFWKIALCFLWVLGACDKDDSLSSSSRLVVTRVSGNDQKGRVGAALASPLVVLVTNSSGQPVADQRVDFEIVEGEGRLATESALSSERGQASTRLTLGDQEGRVTVRSRVFGNEEGVVFTATAIAATGGAAPVPGTSSTGPAPVPDTSSAAPVSWWPAEDSADDQGTAGNHGIMVGTVGFVDGPVGRAFYFDGSSYIEAPSSGMPTGDEARTIALWVRMDNAVSEEAFFAGYGKFGTGAGAFVLGANRADSSPSGMGVFFSQWLYGIGCSACPETFDMELGVWYHLAVTSSTDRTTLYINGAPVKSRFLEVSTPAKTSFYIGSLRGELGTTRRLKGAIDEVLVYNRVLSAEEIQQLFAAGEVLPVP